MRHRLIQLVTVIVLTLLVISPAISVLNIVLDYHLDLEKYQYSLMDSNSYYPAQYDVKSTTYNSYYPSLNIFDINYAIKHWLKWISLLILPCLVLIICFYNQYIVYQNTNLQRQIEILERAWQKDLD
ncbi:hypothetical protein [Calothrix sp. 336/3]|uniref:hypothetical protein n=1 Tax=Calothrix sp. 336/3 TaxID=1337936 RepID=UPI0011874CB7|nr:hypothetical protein [Calothrix sp. 336/3]